MCDLLTHACRWRPVARLLLRVTAVSDEASERLLSALMPCYAAGEKKRKRERKRERKSPAEEKTCGGMNFLPEREILSGTT